MTEAHYTTLIQLLLAALGAVISWVGIRIFKKLDDLSDLVSRQQQEFAKSTAELTNSIRQQIADGDNQLHGRITELDRRVTRVETKCNLEHGQ